MHQPTLPECCLDPSTCCPSPRSQQSITIEVFYLDSNVCDRCRNTLAAVDDAVALMKPIAGALGYALTVHRVHITSLSLAQRHHFVGSPTVRVNGRDVNENIAEDSCLACGSLCGDSVTCRTFTYQGQTSQILPLGLMIETMMKALLSPSPHQDTTPYEVPANLKRFFEGQSTKNP